jgi:hypothetical protein
METSPAKYILYSEHNGRCAHEWFPSLLAAFTKAQCWILSTKILVKKDTLPDGTMSHQ